jgi:hypothetical protein
MLIASGSPRAKQRAREEKEAAEAAAREKLRGTKPPLDPVERHEPEEGDPEG